MTEKTHRTAVVLIPPETVWPPIQAIRRVHDRNARRWMPHVTLLYPFRPQAEFDRLAGAFSGVCRGVAPFEVWLRAFRVFRHGRRSFTLWLDPEPQAGLATLQTALWEVAPDCDEVRRHENGFTPHLSVGQVRGAEEEMLALKAALEAGWTPQVFRAGAVSLIWRNDPPDDVFRVGYTVDLGTGRVHGWEIPGSVTA